MRIIPAHAGQTSGVRVDVSGTADHPRACGANRPDTPTGPPQAGSSPRMRGKRLPSVLPGLLGRIIPAHAGQTVLKAGGQSKGTDHPRACGANDSTSNATGKAHGSSPRMRGKLHRSHLRTDVPRIIPAHAGQTRPKPRTPVSPTDHPRACGANFSTTALLCVLFGSSPRMRGKQSDFMRKLLSAGPSIIGFAQWLQSSYYCSCLQSSAKTPISRGTTPTSLFLGFQNSITLLLLT